MRTWSLDSISFSPASFSFNMKMLSKFFFLTFTVHLLILFSVWPLRYPQGKANCSRKSMCKEIQKNRLLLARIIWAGDGLLGHRKPCIYPEIRRAEVMIWMVKRIVKVLPQLFKYFSSELLYCGSLFQFTEKKMSYRWKDPVCSTDPLKTV